jgi:cytochrome P450
MQATEIPTFPFERTGLAPPTEYKAFRDRGGLTRVKLWDGSIAWLATSYKDVRTLLADNRFSANPHIAGYPMITATRAAVTRYEHNSFIRLDPPDHTVLRRMLTKEFAVSKIQALLPMVQRVVSELTDDLLAAERPADFLQVFALPLPTRVIMEMLGVPYRDHGFFQERSTKKVRLETPPAEAVAAGKEMREYLLDLVKEKEKNPERHDDIIGRLIVDQVRPGHLSYQDCVATLELVMMAGHETTANMTTLGLLSMLQHPEFAVQLRDDPTDELVTRTVEELLRFHSILQFTGARVALEDVPFRDVTIRAGEGVLPMINAANWDPSKFEGAEILDINKRLTNPHVAFGFGVHQCLGQPLARLELGEVFRTIFRRIPTLKLAVPVEQLKFKRNVLVHGAEALPITW